MTRNRQVGHHRPIGIVHAMPMEARGFNAPPLPCGQPVPINNHWVLVRSGIGGANAQRAIRALRDDGVAAVVSWGCAAGLHPDLRPGTVVLPTALIDPQGECIPVDRPLQQRLSHRLTDQRPVCSGTLMSLDTPVVTRQQKARLHRRFGAVALDMESAAIALAARRYQLPCAAVRVVLDPATQTLPDMALHSIHDDGTIDLCRGLRTLAAKPSDWPNLARLAAHAYRARGSLRRAARQLTAAALA